MTHLPEEFSTRIFFGLRSRGVGFRQEADPTVFPANTAVDVHIQGNEHSMSDAVMEGFHPEGLVFMIQKGNGLSDQRDGGLIDENQNLFRPG